MAKRRTPQEQVQDALRDAVDRTVKGAERFRGALEGSRPATQDDLNEFRKELRALGRRLDGIEKRVPKKPAK
jgi:ABC-type transporter Mla subunit MlaD